MHLDEVPQEGLHYKERDTLRKLMYATDREGHYTGVASVGWEAENIATQSAWDEVNESLRETEAAVRSGQLSPIVYFMQKCLMDLPILARYVGKWRWTVRRHMKPAVFKKLKPATLKSYATVFGISVEELQAFGSNKQDS
ncbi:MAG: hypothetical protein JST06_05365 [Bacteroidetes bacterium]|nr:hypothetical protein [Bacteroidota bacterium]MBS1629653.1 hypothetical protein [Bacteroidota bacterium]